MSAAAERVALAAIGHDLMAVRGTAGMRRTAALMGLYPDSPPTRFAALEQVPEWLRFSAERQTTLARLVALRSIAPALAASIDGAWLGALAGMVGEPALDWAIAGAGGGDVRPDMMLAPEQLTQAGFAILAAHLPEDLRCYLAATPLPGGSADNIALADALAFVREQPA